MGTALGAGHRRSGSLLLPPAIQHRPRPRHIHLRLLPNRHGSPVITGMLGGSVPRLATFSIISNITVAILAPVFFTLMGSEAEIPFMETLTTISAKVMPLIILPLILALILLKVAPKVHHTVADRQAVSFYIWAVSLFIVVGRAVSFVMDEPAEAVPEMMLLAILSGIVCCLQFWIGRKIGRRCGDKIAGAQGLGQKKHRPRHLDGSHLPPPSLIGRTGCLCRMAEHHQLRTALFQDPP